MGGDRINNLLNNHLDPFNSQVFDLPLQVVCCVEKRFRLKFQYQIPAETVFLNEIIHQYFIIVSK